MTTNPGCTDCGALPLEARKLCRPCYGRRYRKGTLPPIYQQLPLPGLEPWHGTRAAYLRRKCRCSLCGAAEYAYTVQRREKDPVRFRRMAADRQRRWTQANPERHREYLRQQRRKNPGVYRARGRQHYAANRERYQVWNREWALRNRDYLREKSRARLARMGVSGWTAWRQRYPDKVLELAARTIEHRRERTRRRRARQRQLATVPFTAEQLTERLTLWPGCWICGGPKEAVDHVKPLHAGGAHILANLRPICTPCNSRKWARWRGSQWAHRLPKSTFTTRAMENAS